MRNFKVFFVVAVLGALAVNQASVDAAGAAKKTSQENQVEKDQKDQKDQKENKEKKDRKKDKKDHKDKKDKKDKKDPRETNNCPGGLSKDCGPGACRCPAPSEQQEQVAKQQKEQKEKFEKDQKQRKELLEKLRKQNDRASASKASKRKSQLCPEWHVVTGRGLEREHVPAGSAPLWFGARPGRLCSFDHSLRYECADWSCGHGTARVLPPGRAGAVGLASAQSGKGSLRGRLSRLNEEGGPSVGRVTSRFSSTH
jgi:hypothetical protein